MTIFDEIQASIARLAENAGSSVVGIGQRWGVGSGIVLGEGRVLTNAHNVRGSQVTVTFADGRTAEGNVAGHDIDGDLAVIEADTGQAAALPWATAAPAIGMPVFALSNPGGRGLRVTFGTVSGIDRSFRGPRGLRITGSLEHTAPLLPGSSGGPVLNARDSCSGSTRTASARASTWPYPPTRRCAAGSTRWPAGNRSGRRSSASRSPPATWPGGCAAPSACPTPRACSSATSPRTARPHAPASPGRPDRDGCGPAGPFGRRPVRRAPDGAPTPSS